MVDLMFGPLDEIVRDPRVTDVAVTCDGKVWADRGEGMCECPARIPFRSPQVVREYAVQLCAQLGRRLDDAQPIADASSEEGVRIHAVIAPLVAQGASISIRLPDRMFSSLSTLCGKGLFPREWLPMMRGLVAKQATVLITGGTGAGKTTLLKALLGECGPTERIVTVEEVRELGALPLTNRVSLATREANVEGTGAVGLPDLVKATLRMRPDRVVLGECRGEEIADLLRAYNSGHHGGMTTLHADNVGRVPSRLISLGLLAGLAPQAMTMLAHDAFDVVMHVERTDAGRHIAQIGRLVDRHGDLVGQPLCVWDGASPPKLADDWPEFVAHWRVDAAPAERGGDGERISVPLPARPQTPPVAATPTPTRRPGRHAAPYRPAGMEPQYTEPRKVVSPWLPPRPSSSR
ncbi:Flp pilus assembly complex ATPase component TadA [Bifidobacterium sp. MA2]|uniref:Flp pilus assembly complex ATPase component TadA n=1 Tax=Bifidobacterium santillanense TaxID=2809028 RepID=A0ABS5URD6_9BIFI|nr:Flp pilus assembly complex ATPase component TadA [Bifidobacterium santillanense]